MQKCHLFKTHWDKFLSLCVRFSRALHGCYNNEHAGWGCVACENIFLNYRHGVFDSGIHCMKTSVLLKYNASMLRTICCWGILSPWHRGSWCFSAPKNIYKKNSKFFLPLPCQSAIYVQMGRLPAWDRALTFLFCHHLTLSPWHSYTFDFLGYSRQPKWQENWISSWGPVCLQFCIPENLTQP